MPNTGTPAESTPRIAATAYPAAAGSPGPLEKNTPSGAVARISAAVAVAGSTCTRQPRAAIAAGVAALMPRATAATPERAFAARGGRPREGAGGGTPRGRGAPGLPGAAGSRGRGSPRSGGGGAGGWGPQAPVRRRRGERAGPGDGDAGDALGRQLLVQAAPGPPARGGRRRLPDHVPAHPDPPGLGVIVVDAGVADVRRGHRDDLPAV